MGTSGGIVAGAVVVVVAAVGAGLYVNTLGPEPSEPETVRQAAIAPETVPQPEAAATQTDSDPAQTDTADVAPAPPSIEEVRVEPDGLAVIAGRASPGSKITVLLDGVANTEVMADATGGFAAVTMITPKPDAQVLTLVQRDAGKDIASLDEVIVAPVARPAPVTVAEATPDATDVSAAEDTATVAAAALSDAPAPAPSAEDVDIAALETDAPSPPVSQRAAPTTDSAEAEVTQDQVAPQAPVVNATDPDVAASTVNEVPQDRAEPAATETVQVQPPAPIEDTEQGSDSTASSPTRQAQDTVVADSAPTEPAGPAPDLGSNDVSEPPVAIADLPAADAQPGIVASVTAPPAPAILKSTEDGIEVLSSAPPEALQNIEIDTISYSQVGAVELAGRAQTEAEVVRVYVDNRPVTDISVDAEGRWRGELPDIDTGVYTLRVDEIDATGDVTSRVETPFQREDPDVLAAADVGNAPASRITVQTGNTLWGISRARYGDGRLYVQVFDANRDRIRDPDLIFPGQIFDLPE